MPKLICDPLQDSLIQRKEQMRIVHQTLGRIRHIWAGCTGEPCIFSSSFIVEHLRDEFGCIETDPDRCALIYHNEELVYDSVWALPLCTMRTISFGVAARGAQTAYELLCPTGCIITGRLGSSEKLGSSVIPITATLGYGGILYSQGTVVLLNYARLAFGIGAEGFLGG